MSACTRSFTGSAKPIVTTLHRVSHRRMPRMSVQAASSGFRELLPRTLPYPIDWLMSRQMQYRLLVGCINWSRSYKELWIALLLGTAPVVRNEWGTRTWNENWKALSNACSIFDWTTHALFVLCGFWPRSYDLDALKNSIGWILKNVVVWREVLLSR